MPSNSKLLHRLRSNLRFRQYSPRTEEAYAGWVRRFVRFHGLRHLEGLGESEVRAFLEHLTEARQLGSSSVNQALAALLFLYAEVLRCPLGGLGSLPRPKQSTCIPVVLTVDEIRRVLLELDGSPRLIGMVLYGSGMRLMECLTLRVKDVDLERGEVRVRRGGACRGSGCSRPPGGTGTLRAGSGGGTICTSRRCSGR